MNTILLEKKEILEYMKNILNELKTKPYIVNDAKYHHNSTYHDAPYICQHGILTLSDLKKLRIKNYNDEILKKLSDIESHINGIDSVSLAVMGLTDLYPGEDEYNSFNPNEVDFLVSDTVQANRTTIHYGNEYISPKSITPDKLKSIDIRILTLIDMIEKNISRNEITLEQIIKNYNHLKDIAIAIKTYNLNIPIREMSENNYICLDIDKLSTTQKIKLK